MSWEPESEEQVASDRLLAEQLAAAETAVERQRAEAVAASRREAERLRSQRASASSGAGRGSGQGSSRAKAAGATSRPAGPAAASAAEDFAPPREVTGALPPRTSRTGRRYYAFRACHPSGPCVVCGSGRALALLGGQWFSHGGAPEGFGSLESAINACAAELPAGAPNAIEVRW